LEGLQPDDSAPFDRRQVDRERLQAAQAVVAGIDPDILVLNEALYCRQFAGKAVDYGQLFGFPYQASALYDEAWGNTILSRHPITKSREMRIYNRGGLIATIDTPQGNLSVASYHPHPGRQPENKASDFTGLIDGLTGPLILCGDMNCISPEDPIDRTQLILAFRSFSTKAEKAVDQFINSGVEVFNALSSLGLKDAVPLEGRRYTIPTDLINLDKSSGMRIDHILSNEAIAVIGGEVIHNTNTNRASDHHPVMVEFQIRIK